MNALVLRLRAWLRPPAINDVEEERLARIVHWLAILLFFALFVPILLRLGQPGPHLFSGALFVEQVIIVVAFFINRRGGSQRALLMMLFGLLGVAAYLAVTSGDGLHDTAILILPSLLVVASMLMDRRLFSAFALLAIGVFVTIAWLEIERVSVNHMSGFTTLFDLIEGSMILGLTALSVGLLMQNMQFSLRRARESEAALARTNAELQRQSLRLAESEARYRLVVETAQDPIVSTDINGRFVFVNGAAARLSGYAIEDMLGMHFFDFCLPEERNRVRRAFFRQFHERVENRSYEVALVSRNGAVHWLNMSVSLELSEGALSGFHVVARDITDRRHAEDEVRRLNQELEHRVHERTAELESTMQELQRISYTVSHDLRAPLRHIGAYAEMSQTRPSVREDAYAHKYLQTIAFSAKWMGMLVDGLIEYLSISQTEMHASRIDMTTVVEEVIRDLGPESAGRVIDWRVGPLPAVVGDRRLLRQAFDKIIGNAVKFTQTRATAVIEIGVVPNEANESEHRIFIRDNGIGFDAKYQDRLFGLFESLHSRAEYAGAGIGLANVRRIIHRHGGRIWADGAVDQGATIFFTLPIHHGAGPVQSSSKGQNAPSRSSQR